MKVSKTHMVTMRSPLGRVRGLGSAKSGTAHWWAQRLTAIALVPLAIWFVFAVLAHLGAPREAVAHWMGRPINAVLLLALSIALFHHLHLGLQVVIEDYIHTEAARLAVLLAMRAVVALLFLTALIAILRMAL
ncbi:MAG: succinate dehydrogenase, hydrophobic membrane anchor protein [Acidibrevibacterium sp.]|uniref:succinate dehydrogenase, hydrophobic membrane anchor protein n=1 Tax=Acidibrevibacterium sp. TaxID=2606776 RepID=UPI003D028A73